MKNRNLSALALMMFGLTLGASCTGRASAEQRSVGSATVASAVVTLPPPSDAAKAFQLSYDSEAQGKVPAALAALDSLPAPQRNGYVAELRRGWLLYVSGRHAESITSYTHAIAAAPASVEARVGKLAPLLALRRWVDAEATARDVLRRDPGNYTASLRLAFALFNQAKLPESAATYRALVGAYPSDVDARAGLGWAELKQGHSREASGIFSELLEIAPQNALAKDGLRAALAKK